MLRSINKSGVAIDFPCVYGILRVSASSLFRPSEMRYLLLFISLCVGGCATLIHGSTQEIEIASEPSEARVEVDGRPVGETPTTAVLKRGQSYLITIYSDGHEPYTTTLRNGRSYWTALNIFNLFLPGLLIDLSTGAYYSFEPGQIDAELEALHPEADSSQLGIRVGRDANVVLPTATQTERN